MAERSLGFCERGYFQMFCKANTVSTLSLVLSPFFGPSHVDRGRRVDNDDDDDDDDDDDGLRQRHMLLPTTSPIYVSDLPQQARV